MSHADPYRQVYPNRLMETFSGGEHFILTLLEPESMQAIPILIGPYEFQAVTIAQEHQSTLRPMTHRLMLNVMETYGLQLQQVVIEGFEEGIFHATLYVSDGFNEKRIDSRSSDAIVLALLSDKPIWVTRQVFDETAVPVETENDTAETAHAMTLEELEHLLEQYEEQEDYERAAEVLKQIEEYKSNHESL